MPEQYEISDNGDVRDLKGAYYGRVQFMQRDSRNPHHRAILAQWDRWLKAR